MNDISLDFQWNKNDALTFKKILPYEATPEAIHQFARYAYRLPDYAYWFGLSTLWVSYTGWNDLDLWKRLFSSQRSNRETSLMKPSELDIFRSLPDQLTLYRAHRPEEIDWIAYTLLPEKAAEFAARRKVHEVSEYCVAKSDVLAIFLRRGEYEAIVLDKAKAVHVADIPIILRSEI